MTGRVYVDDANGPGRPTLVVTGDAHHRHVRAEALRVAAEVENLSADANRDWVVCVGLGYSVSPYTNRGHDVAVDVWIEVDRRGDPDEGLIVLTDAAALRGIEVSS